MIERLRDQMIYSSRSISLEELRRTRVKQADEKSRGRRLNAKFSSGALVDLEYAVQILQVNHGEEFPDLRTPSVHLALEALKTAEVIAEEEVSQLVPAYDFLRKLINGLRMLRGSAKDLFLPPKGSLEFRHLARRMGYSFEKSISPDTALFLDFETTTASVRAFLERHFGQQAVPPPATGNTADLILSENLPGKRIRKILKGTGVKDDRRALTNFRNLAGSGTRRELFARLAILAGDVLSRMPDPDMALNQWERFVISLESPIRHFRQLLSQPRRLEILLSIFSTSLFLSHTLVRNPEFLEWATRPENLHRIRTAEEMLSEMRVLSASSDDEDRWLDDLRIFRRREILRIGTKDLCLDKPVEEILEELTYLAEAMVRAALERIWSSLSMDREKCPPNASEMFCIMAFGKLGGEELNYSSDIDLLGFYAPPAGGENGEEMETIYGKAMERIRKDLSRHTKEGYAYRVDFRLRPFGRSGALVHTRAGLEQYYRNSADLWEVQAALKLRPIAGNITLGHSFLESLRPLLREKRSEKEIAVAVEQLREKSRSKGESDVKNGRGGIRDVEFLVQGLQLIHAPRYPDLLTGNTLEALQKLRSHGIIPEVTGIQISRDYLYLRKVEHYLQIWEDRQIHSLPSDPADIAALARRIRGSHRNTEEFIETVKDCRERVYDAYSFFLLNRQFAI